MSWKKNWFGERSKDWYEDEPRFRKDVTYLVMSFMLIGVSLYFSEYIIYKR
jgi:hypothetical protein